MKMLISALPSRLIRSSFPSAALIRNRNLLFRSFSEELNFKSKQFKDGVKLTREAQGFKPDGVELTREAQGFKTDCVLLTRAKDLKDFFVANKRWVIAVTMILPNHLIGSVKRLIPNWMFPIRPAHTRIKQFNIKQFDVKGLLEDAERSEDWKSFASWMSEHSKKYESDEEKLYRFGIFRENLKVIEKLNKEATRGCGFGLNGYSDLTDDEFPIGRVLDFPDTKWLHAFHASRS